MKILSRFLYVLPFVVLFSCFNDDQVPEQSYYGSEYENLLRATLDIDVEANGPLDYTFNFPEHFGRNPSTFDNDLATLGRVLFYDKKLSKDESVSCGSCHKQELAFADDFALSRGIELRQTDRNSIALGSVFNFNLYYGSISSGSVPFFWDNRASTPQEQSEQTLMNVNEMGMDTDLLVSRVKDTKYYEPLLNRAYGNTHVSKERILDAIGEFINSLGSSNSTYDKALNEYTTTAGVIRPDVMNIDLAMLNAEENLGKDIYLSKCSSCHGVGTSRPAVIAANNGLSMVYKDQGQDGLSVFKVPTLRNIELTAPYMHDGSINTLEEVIDHYSSGIQNHESLSDQLKDINGAKKFNFTDDEKSALVAFLKTLTDDEFLATERFSDPFLN